MKKIIYFMIFILSQTILANDDLFKKGQEHYNNGNYQKAIDCYTEILDQKKHSASLYFNLANAYYKTGAIAPSIFYYEKALQLDPNDKDTQINLQFAQKMKIDNFSPVPKPFYERIKTSILNLYSGNGWAIQTILTLILSIISFFAYYLLSSIWQKKLFFILFILLLGTSGISYLLGDAKNKTDKTQRYAILFDKEVKTFSEPISDAEPIFVLHEGEKVRTMESKQDWTKIELIDGRVGWIQNGTFRQLN